MADQLVIIPDKEIEKLQLAKQILAEIGPQAEKFNKDMAEMVQVMEKLIAISEKMQD
jgi:hypothetical protein